MCEVLNESLESIILYADKLRPAAGATGWKLYVKAIISMHGSVLTWYGIWNLVTNWGYTVEECGTSCFMCENTDFEGDLSKIGWYEYGENCLSENDTVIRETFDFCPNLEQPNLRSDMIWWLVTALICILCGTELTQAGVTGTHINDWTHRNFGYVLGAIGTIAMIGQWASSWNLIEQGFYWNNYCGAYPELTTTGDYPQCSTEWNWRQENSCLCGPCSDFYDDGVVAYNDNGTDYDLYYYYYETYFAPGDTFPNQCSFPINSYNYISEPRWENVTQDILLVVFGILGTSLLTGLWSLGFVYPPWFEEWWYQVYSPEDSLLYQFFWNIRGFLSIFTQNFIWCASWNIQLYYSEIRGEDQLWWNLGYTILGLFIMFLTGNLVSAAWMDDEPDDAIDYNFINELVGLIGGDVGSRPMKAYAEHSFWDKYVFWYLRGLSATFGFFIHLNGFWQFIEYINMTCMTPTYNAAYCFSNDPYRNYVISCIGLVMLWWARAIWWNANIDVRLVFPDKSGKGTRGKKEKLMETVEFSQGNKV